MKNKMYCLILHIQNYIKFQVDATSTSDEPPEMDDANLVKCKGCPANLEINKIQKHLAQSLSCKEKYTEEDLNELKKLCDSFSRKKKNEKRRRKRQNKSEQKKKKQKTSKVCHF